MTVNSGTFMSDMLGFVKSDLLLNVTDPISGLRPGNSKFIMTSYPERAAVYPLITIKTSNITGPRMGMQDTSLYMNFVLEVRIWARNQKEKDDLFVATLNRLKNNQFTTTSGSVPNGLHDFNLMSCVDIDEDGANPKSKVMEVSYTYVNS